MTRRYQETISYSNYFFPIRLVTMWSEHQHRALLILKNLKKKEEKKKETITKQISAGSLYTETEK